MKTVIGSLILVAASIFSALASPLEDYRVGEIVALSNLSYLHLYDMGILDHQYVYGRITKLKGEDITLQYVDGQTERTNIYVIRHLNLEEKVLPDSKAHSYEYYRWDQVELPGEFLQDVARGIEFAFNSGAAQEVSGRDLCHFHVLVRPDFEDTNVLRAIAERVGILFHSQEHVSYGPESFRKRSFLVKDGVTSTIFPLKGDITVRERDLGLKSTIEMQGYFVDLSGLDARRIEMPTKNIIQVGSKIIYVGFARRLN